jgi:hypothetical protein
MYYNFQQSLSEHNCPAKNKSLIRFSVKIYGLECPFCKKMMKITKKQFQDRIDDHTLRHMENP